MRTSTADLWRYLARPDRWKVHLGLAACLVLLIGAALAPPPRTPAASVPRADATPLLREELERRDPGDAFQRVALVAPRIDASLVAFTEKPAAEPRSRPDHPSVTLTTQPTGHGLVVSGDGLVLSHIDAIAGDDTVAVQLADRTASASVVAIDPRSGLLLLSLDSAVGTAAARIAPAPPATGAVTATAMRWMPNGVATTQPAYVASAIESDVNVVPVGGDLSPGTPVFDLDGVAVAIVTRGQQAVAIAPALARLEEIRASDRALPRTLGLRLQPVSTAMRPLLGEGVGALIVGLDDGGPAHRSGVEIGDGLKAIGGQPVDSVDAAIDLIARAGSTASIELLVDRAGTEVSITTAPALALSPQSPRVDPAGAGAVRASAVLSTDVLTEMAIPADAVVVEVDRRRLGERAARARLTRRPGPHLVLFAHGDEAWFDVVGDQP